MARTTGIFLVILVLLADLASHCGACQSSCRCDTISSKKTNVLKAQCSREPIGEWARNVQILTLRGTVHQLEATTLQYAWKLNEADLSYCNITKLMPRALANATNLLLLRLSHNLIEEIDSEAFSKLQNLRQLYLDSNRLVTLRTDIYASMKYLEELFLQKNYLTDIPQLPSTLKYLDASYNNFTTFNFQLMENLLYLNICMNPIGNIISNIIIKNLKSLCLSGNIAKISKTFSTNFLSLQNFTFISYPNTSTFKKRMQDILLSHHNVVTLHIGNTNLHNLIFLQHMNKIKILKLQQVNITNYGSIDKIFASLKSMEVMDIERSPGLANAVMRQFHVLFNLKYLNTISFKNANVTHLPCDLCQMQRLIKIDFQDNPLDCNCRIAEIESALPHSLQDYLLKPNNTKCQSPQQVFEWPIYKYTHLINCSRKNECAKENNMCQISKNFETTTNKILLLDEENSIYYTILATIVGILSIALIGLLIIYVVLKKQRRIEPQHEHPPQSFQQLQQAASEDTLLI